MKKIISIVAMGAVSALFSQSGVAATTSANFTTSVTLTSKCRVKTGSDNQTLSFGNYEAFSAATVNATSIHIDFECTRGFNAAPNVEFDTGADKTSSAAGATATGEGVIAGLRYTMSVTAGARTTGTAATTADIGTPDTYRYTISGAMEANQAGTSSALGTQARVLTITY